MLNCTVDNCREGHKDKIREKDFLFYCREWCRKVVSLSPSKVALFLLCWGFRTSGKTKCVMIRQGKRKRKL